MAQFSIAPVQSVAVATVATAGSTVPLGGASSPSKQELEFNRSVSAAVQTLNEVKYAGDGREVTISLDQTTRRPVVRVVETATKEVIQQWPSEYALQLAAESQKTGKD